MISISILKQIWFTGLSMLKWPERTTSYLINRAGDSSVYQLAFLYSFTLTIEKLFTNKEFSVLSLLLSPLLLGFIFVAIIAFVKVQSVILQFVSGLYGGEGSDFKSSLVIYWTFLPLIIIQSLLNIFCTIVHLDVWPWLNIAMFVIYSYYLYKCTVVSDSVNSKKSFFIILTYLVAPALLLFCWLRIMK